MKKFTTIFVALIYLVMSTGFVVNIHYCMGDIAEVAIGHAPENDRCPKCGMDNDGCCKDETLVVKYDDTQALVKNAVEGFTYSFNLTQTNSTEPAKIVSAVLPAFGEYTPPEYSTPPLCILHSVFRI